MISIYDQLTRGYGAVTFEAFINLLVDITEDQTTPDQLREAFRGIAGDKVSMPRNRRVWLLNSEMFPAALRHRTRPARCAFTCECCGVFERSDAYREIG